MRIPLKCFLGFCFFTVFYCSSCEEEMADPPIANFTLSEGFQFLPFVSDVRADVTSVGFVGTSTGSITSYSWEFEDGLGTSNDKNPNYVFDFAGERNVTLTVRGPGGSDSHTQKVHCFTQLPCGSFDVFSTYSKESISHFRENGLVRSVQVRISNPYVDALTLRFYRPNDWLNGIYNNIIYQAVINPGQTIDLPANWGLTNEWGIQLTSINGLVTCTRAIGLIGYFNGSQFLIEVDDIIDGEL